MQIASKLWYPSIWSNDDLHCLLPTSPLYPKIISNPIILSLCPYTHYWTHKLFPCFRNQAVIIQDKNTASLKMQKSYNKLAITMSIKICWTSSNPTTQHFFKPSTLPRASRPPCWCASRKKRLLFFWIPTPPQPQVTKKKKQNLRKNKLK